MSGKPQNVHATDVYRAIAQQTSLTAPQVRECFLAYKNLIEQIADSSTRPLNYSMPIPLIGTVKFVRKYQDPNKQINGAIKYVDMSKAKVKEQYDKLVISVYPTLDKKVKDLSYARFMQTKEFVSIKKQIEKDEEIAKELQDRNQSVKGTDSQNQ